MIVVSSVLRKAGLALLAGGVVAGLWWRGDYYAERTATGAALLSAAIATGNAAAEVAQTQARAGRIIDATARVAAVRKQQIRSEADRQREVILHAPPDSDGPLAPVLRDQLNRLPEP